MRTRCNTWAAGSELPSLAGDDVPSGAKVELHDAVIGAERVIQEEEAGQVPVHLRDASYKGAARLGHGKNYRYPHSYEGHWVAQQYLPDIHKDRRFYNPSDQGYEAEVKERVETRRAARD